MTWNITTTATPPMGDVFFTGLPTGTATITLTRTVTGTNTLVAVRGATDLAVSGVEVRVLDYDAPVGRAFTYTITAKNAAGGNLAVTGGVSASQLIAANPDPSLVWLSNPFSPGGSMLLDGMVPSDGARSHQAGVTLHADGRSAPPVAAWGKRLAPSSWTWTVRTTGNDEGLLFEDLVADGAPILIRTHPDPVRHRTGMIWLAVADVASFEQRLGTGGQTYWTLTGSEVAAPAYGAVDHPWDYAAAAARYVGMTYAGLATAYSGLSYLDLARAAVNV